MASKKAKEIVKKIAREPSNPKLYQQLGDVYKSENDIKEALKAYQKSAELFEQQQKPHAAISMYKQILNLDPNRTDVQLRLATILIKLDSPAEAREHLESAIRRLEASGDTINLRRAQNLMEQLVTSTWQQKVKDAIALYKGGNRARASGRLKDVVRDLIASQKSPLDAYKLFLGQVYDPAIFSSFVDQAWQEKKIEDIVILFEKLDKSAQKEPVVLEAVADAYIQLGKSDLALQFYGLAVDELLKKADRKEASRLALQMLQIDPSNQKAKKIIEESKEKVEEVKVEPEEIEIELEFAEEERKESVKVEEKKAEAVEEILLPPEEIFGEVAVERQKAAELTVEEKVDKIREEAKPIVEEKVEVKVEQDQEAEIKEVKEEVKVPVEAQKKEVIFEERMEEPSEEVVKEEKVKIEVEAKEEVVEKREEVKERIEETISEDMLKSVLAEFVERDPLYAISVLENYLRAHPAEFHWQYKLAELYLKAGDIARFKLQIEKCAYLAKSEGLKKEELDCWNLLLKVEPTSEIAHLNLKDIYKETEPKEAIKHLLALAKFAKEQDQFQQAIDFYEEIIEIDPNHLEAHAELKDYYLKQSRIPEALSELHKLVELLSEQGRINEAESNLRQILEIEPADIEARKKLFEVIKQRGVLSDIESELFALEEFYQNLGKLDESLTLLEEGLNLGLDEDGIRNRIKQIYFMRGETDKALEQIRSLVAIAINRGNYDKALSYLEELLRVSPEDFQAHEQIKDIYLRRGDFESAKRELFVLIDLAKLKGEIGRLENYLKELVERNPTDEAAKIELVNLYLEKGKSELAEKILFELAESEILKGDLISAEGTFQRILELNPKSEQAKRGLVKIYIDRDQRHKAADSLWELANIKAEQGDVEGANAILNEALNVWPDHEPSLRTRIELAVRRGVDDEAAVAMLELAALYQREGKLDDAIAVLNEVIEKRPELEQAYRRLSQLYLYMGRLNEACDVLTRFALWLRHTGQLNKAVEVLADVLKIAPEHQQVRLERKEIYLNLGNRPKAIAELFSLADQFKDKPDEQRKFLEEILKLDPKNSVARERLITILKAQNNVSAAIDNIKYFLEEAIEQKRFNEVIERARQIMELDPENLEARKKLAEAYRKLGDRKRAVDELISVAQMYLHRKDFDSAEQLLRIAVEEEPQDTRPRFILAELYRNQGENEKALQEMHRMADYLISVGALSEAHKVFKNILQQAPTDNLALKKLADLERRLGRRDEAVKILFSLADSARSAGNLDEAEEYYNQILRLDPFNIQAQSDLSSVLIEKGEKERACEKLLLLSSRLALAGRLEEAQAQLNKILELLPAHERALYFKAEILHKRGDISGAVDNLCLAADAEANRGDIIRAQRLLRQALRLDPLSFKAHERLVQLYLKENRTDLAVSEIIKFVKSLMRKRSYDEAQNLLESALKLDPSNRLVLTSLKEIALARGDQKRAIELLLTLAHLAREQKLIDEEVLNLKEIIMLDPENSDAHSLLVERFLSSEKRDMALSEIYRLAELKTQKAALDEAEKLYLEACSIDLQAEFPHQMLLELYTKQGRTEGIIREYMILADIANKKGQFDREIDYLRKVMSIDPLNFEAHGKLKERYLQFGRVDEAVEELSTFAEALKRSNKIPEAIDVYEELLNLTKDQPELLITLARLLLEAQQVERAVSRLESAARIARQKGLLKFEEEALKELLNLAPDRMEERKLLAELFVSTNRLKEAVDEYQILAERSRELGDFEKAVSYLKRIIEFAPDHITAHELLKNVYLEQNKTAEAQVELETLIKLNRERANQQAVISHLDELLRIAQDSERAYLLSAEIHEERGAKDELLLDLLKLDEIALKANDPAKGLSYLRRAIDIAPNKKELLERATDRALSVGQKDEAIEYLIKLAELEAENPDKRSNYLRRVVELDYTRSSVRRLLARAYEDSGEKDKALKEYFALVDEAVEKDDREALRSSLESIIRLDPTNVEAGWRLVDIYLGAGENERALAQLFDLVDAAIEAGRRKLAEMFLREIFKLDPQNVRAKDKLADLFLKFVEIKEEHEQLALEAERALHVNDLAKARKLLEQLSNLEPENFKVKEKLKEIELRLSRGVLEVSIAREEEKKAITKEEEIRIDWAEQKASEETKVPHQEAPLAIDYEALLEEAKQLINEELHQKAIQKLEKVLHHPQFAQRAKVYFSWISYKEGDISQAIAYLAEVDFDNLPDKERKLASILQKRLES